MARKIDEIIDEAVDRLYDPDDGLDSGEATEYVIDRYLDQAIYIVDMKTWGDMTTPQRKMYFRADDGGKCLRRGVQDKVLGRCRRSAGRRGSTVFEGDLAHLPLFPDLDSMVGRPVKGEGGRKRVVMTKFGDLSRDGWVEVENFIATIAARTAGTVQWMRNWRHSHDEVWARTPTLKAEEVFRLAAKGHRPPGDDRPQPRA
jgi:hypothetical protein